MVLDDGPTDGRTAEMTWWYKVADFTFAVTLKDDRHPDAFLPSFAPFRTEKGSAQEQLFELIEYTSLPERPEAALIDEDRNDMGHTRLFRTDGGYRIEFRYGTDARPHVMDFDEAFADVRAMILWEDRYVRVALSSMLRVIFAQAILPHAAVSMHSSVIEKDGRAFLFMGKSGTGKSTHSRLWLEHIEGSCLLNDDNPIVRIVGDKVMAYGSPWSGKTHCYRNENAEVAAFVRLRQAPQNRFTVCEDVSAFGALLPGCSVLRQDKRLHGEMCGTLIEMSAMALVGEMECLPDRDAAVTCYESVLNNLLTE